MAVWGLRWRSRRIVAQDCDVGGFMWDFHRTLRTEALPDGETVILVSLTDRTDFDMWRIIARSNNVIDLCTQDPGWEVDVYLTAPFAGLITLWMGNAVIHEAIDNKTIVLDGPRHLVGAVADWIPQSPMVNVRPADLAKNS
ncbi:hypothetical protein [Pseudovibrio sp. Tun.PSC04-5.I4]|uniref:hypothetical protein n=1 Tax=Pseudovibrio sp. Tun.PSC04-5.I4 TaxID=1798213 RepID=UPI000B874B5E|nr:hypothetical protein [Pseudovibrio sp. Tun.PSC04-5.I4]